MSNPIFNADRWEQVGNDIDTRRQMTVGGAVNKTFILLAIMLATIAVMWGQFWATTTSSGAMPKVAMGLTIGGAIGGLVLCLISMFAMKWAPVLGPVYAVAQGLFLGGLTMMMNLKYPGIPILAAVATIATFTGMLALYKLGVIRATANFRRGVIIATVGLFLSTGLLLLLSAFGIGTGLRQMLFVENSWIGIAFSVGCIILAALNLVLDFDFIESHAQAGSPKLMEWVAAFGLLVTLVWLYIEILRLLAKLRR